MQEEPTLTKRLVNGTIPGAAVKTTTTTLNPLVTADISSQEDSAQRITSPSTVPVRTVAAEEDSLPSASSTRATEDAGVPQETENDQSQSSPVSEAAGARSVPAGTEDQNAVQSMEGHSTTADSQSAGSEPIEKPLQSADFTVTFLRVIPSS